MSWLQWLKTELKPSIMMVCLSVIICFVIHAVAHRYTVHSNIKCTTVFDAWTGKVTVVDVK